MEVFATKIKSSDDKREKGSGGGNIRIDKDIEVPFSHYKAVFYKPYTAKHFQIEEYDDLDDMTDVDGIRKGVEEVEKFVLKKLKENNLEDSTANYEQIIQEMLDRLGVKEGEIAKGKFFKLVKMIKLMKRENSLDARLQKTLRKL
jgi:hypothetical protein